MRRVGWAAAGMAALALATAVGAGAAGLTVRGTQILQDGKPIFLRGSYYVQPAAYHHCFLTELDERQVPVDFTKMRESGLNCVAISVNWGDFLPHFDPGRPPQWDRRIDGRFRRLLQAARKENLWVDLWFGTARMPLGVPGVKAGEPQTDLAGYKHQAFAGYTWPNYPGCVQFADPEWEGFVAFHRHVAELTRGFDNVIFDPLDWQHLNMNAWCWGNARNLAGWRAWLKERNPDLAYWSERWGEKLASWDEALFPMDDWVRRSAARYEGSPYAGKADTTDQDKWQDFREWHDALHIRVMETLNSTLKQVRPDVLIGQRVDLWHHGDFRMNTWAVKGVDFIFQGWYSDKPEQARAPEEGITTSIKDVTSRWPKPMPLVFWETGDNVQGLPQAEDEALQAQQLAETDRVVRALGLCGWLWWTWRDYPMGKESMRFGLNRLDGSPKPALTALKRLTEK